MRNRYRRMMRLLGLAVAFGMLTADSTALAGAEPALPCVGDCNLDRRVSIDELIVGVGISLGERDLEECSQFDSDDLRVSIAELILGVAYALRGCAGEPTVLSASGDIAATVNGYRELLGSDNGGEPGQRSDGRREINWDQVPDEDAAPNFLPADYFNAATAPLARGALLTATVGQVQVSADSDNPTVTPPRFGHINTNYADAFVTFSAERLFSPVGGNTVDLTFFVPGTDTPALVRGFGAVYTDVDQGGSEFEYFDAFDRSLGQFTVPPADNGLSFLGVAFETAVVSRVRIIYGNRPLGPDEGEAVDVSVMDDFIFGEPQPLD